MAITKSKRTEFIGAHITRETREALQRETVVRRCSLSALTAELVVESLIRHGHRLHDDGSARMTGEKK